jgi:hypothetical protein
VTTYTSSSRAIAVGAGRGLSRSLTLSHLLHSTHAAEACRLVRVCRSSYDRNSLPVDAAARAEMHDNRRVAEKSLGGPGSAPPRVLLPWCTDRLLSPSFRFK